MEYLAPTLDMRFVTNNLAGLADVAKLPGFEDASFETAQAVLEECAKLCGQVLAPLNVHGDRYPSTWKDGTVTATDGFGDAFLQSGAKACKASRILLNTVAKAYLS